jgi:hypothetical protein
MGGGMGDNMSVISRQDEDFYARLVFDMGFYMLINIVFMNIVFGIIVDTFSQMRDEYDQRNLDASDNCFVCGLTRGDFGKGGKNFDKHKDKHHNPWKYVYYLYYLKEKKEDELSGLEQAVLASFHRLNTDWIPIGSTLYLETEGDDDQIAALQTQIESMGDNIKTVTNDQAELIKNMNTLMEDVKTIKTCVESHGVDESIDAGVRQQSIDLHGGKKGIYGNNQQAPLGKPPLSKTLFPGAQSMRENQAQQQSKEEPASSTLPGSQMDVSDKKPRGRRY